MSTVVLNPSLGTSAFMHNDACTNAQLARRAYVLVLQYICIHELHNQGTIISSYNVQVLVTNHGQSSTGPTRGSFVYLLAYKVSYYEKLAPTENIERSMRQRTQDWGSP